MINKLTLTCFRKHIYLSVPFTSGIQVIRAANEGGKSTLLEAIGYALFGSKALRTTPGQVVTWGYDIKSLKVQLEVTIEGASYTFTRGRTGAEVVTSGTVLVTGQEAVSAFAARLLGADLSTAYKLMVAPQNSIRGALEEGPKAVTEMIENLAGLDTFDKIFNLVSTRLLHGPTYSIEDKLNRMRGELSELLLSAPKEPNKSEFDKYTSDTENRITELASALQKAHEDTGIAQQAWSKGSDSYYERSRLEAHVQSLTADLRKGEELVNKLTLDLVIGDTEETIKTLEDQLRYIENITSLSKAYFNYRNMPKVPEWSGSKKELDDRLEHLSTVLADMKKEYNRLISDIRMLKSNKFDSDTCSKCGQKLPNAETISLHNKEIDEQVSTLTSAARDLENRYDTLEAEQTNLQLVARVGDKFCQVAAMLAHYIDWDRSTYPGTATWSGPVPETPPTNSGELRVALSKANTRLKAAEVARARLGLAAEQVDGIRANLDIVENSLKECTEATKEELSKLRELVDNAEEYERSIDYELFNLRLTLSDAIKEQVVINKIWDMFSSQVDNMKGSIKAVEEELAAIIYTNNLIKKLKSIRAVIADKLWNIVLKSASVIFSTIRKEDALISKEKSGFMVNGRPIESLSGSTLDILGLAFRCAILRSFLPNCNTLILDEPMAACDEDRSESLLGTIKSVNFKQTLLVSHDEISESIADNIILL